MSCIILKQLSVLIAWPRVNVYLMGGGVKVSGPMANPVAIITGGTRGIGKGIALSLAQLGYRLVLNHVSPANAALSQTLEQLNRLGATCHPCQADISHAQSRAKLIAFTQETFGACHLLVNNAGVAPAQRVDILETSPQSYQRVMGINLQGPFFLTQQIAKWMIQQKQDNPTHSCRIVNVSSISAYASSPDRPEYCLSKAGIAMMTQLYADKLSAYDIPVFEIRPGIIKTDMTSVVAEKYNKKIAEGLTPTKRWGTPHDVAQVVGSIASGHFDFSTGQVFHVDGGFSLRRL